jgi:membrane fusion protein, heavy metal efflux system
MNARKRWKWIPAVVLVGLMRIGGARFLAFSRPGRALPVEEKKESDRKEEGFIMPAEEQRVSLGLKIGPVTLRAPEQCLSVTGKIATNPDRTVVVSSRTSGRVVKVMARLGDTVNAGTPVALLGSLEATEALAELAQCESGLALAQVKAEKERNRK